MDLRPALSLAYSRRSIMELQISLSTKASYPTLSQLISLFLYPQSQQHKPNHQYLGNNLTNIP